MGLRNNSTDPHEIFQEHYCILSVFHVQYLFWSSAAPSPSPNRCSVVLDLKKFFWKNGMLLNSFTRSRAARLTPLLILLAAISSLCVHAQEFRALVTGRIVDSSGASIAGAQVSIVNTATGTRTAAVSGSDGDFALTQLAPGEYELSVEAPGFRAYVRKGITLAVGDKVNLD